MTKDGVANKQLASKQHDTINTDKNPRAGSSEDTLAKVKGYVNEWLEYRKKLTPGWERDTKLYNNERVEYHYEGVADTFVPMTYSTIEAMSSALSTADYSTKFIPQDLYKYLKDRLMPGFTGATTDESGAEVAETEEQYLVRAFQNTIQGDAISDEALEVLNAIYDYAWDKGNWTEEIGYMIDDGLQIGTGAVWMSLVDGLPKIENVPFPNYVFDPLGTDDTNVRFGGRRYLSSLSAMKDEKIADPVTGKKVKRYTGLSAIGKRTNNQAEDKTDRDMQEEILFGSTLDIKNTDGTPKDTDQVEVIELYTNERMYTLVNRKVLAEDVENPIVAQAKIRGIKDTSRLIKIPGTTWANLKKKSLLVGRSETSTFWKEQERLNDTTNQKGDAVTRALLQQYRADPALKSQKASIGVPGAVLFGSPNQFEAIPPAIVPGAVFSEEASIKNNIRETTATDQIVKGVESTGNITATEAKLQVAQSGQRIEKKIAKLEQGALKRIARLALQYIRLFVVDPYLIPKEGNNGIQPMLYTPDKYNYDFEPKVTLTISAQNKRKQEQREGLETYKMLIADPTNNLQETKKILLPKIVDLDKDEINRISSGQPVPQTPNMPEETMPPAVQPVGAMA